MRRPDFVFMKDKTNTQPPRKYLVELTEKQMQILEYACERQGRLIWGQLEHALQEPCEEAWHEKYAETHPRKPDGQRDLGHSTNEFWEMQEHVENACRELKSLCWGDVDHGVGYYETADILFDLYHVMRYQRYLDMPKEIQETCRWTVMSDKPRHYGTEPLALISKKEE